MHRVLARTLLPALILAAGSLGCTDQVTEPGEESGTAYALRITPPRAAMSRGGQRMMNVRVVDKRGRPVRSAKIELTSTDESVARIERNGKVRGVGKGRTKIIAVDSTTGVTDTATIEVSDPPTYRAAPTTTAEFILGPQVPLGSQPWPWFDQMQTAGATKWHQAYMTDAAGADNYYDLGLAIYQLHARSGSAEHVRMAREVAMKSWLEMPDHSAWTANPNPFGISPRMLPFGSLVMLALEGGNELPEVTFYNENDASYSKTYALWDYLADYSRHHYRSWLGARLENDGLWAGVRDGGMLMHGIAMLAKAHPDAAVRTELTGMVAAASKDYYARLQKTDGSWLWNPGNEEDGNEHFNATQPFMLGLLLEGMIAAHQLTGDAAVGNAIVKGAEAIYRDMYDRNTVPFSLLPGKQVRGVFYIAYGDQCKPVIGVQQGCGNDFDQAGDSWQAGNKVKTIRQRNSLVVHAFGYAYKLTNDARFREWGDDIFGATYGGTSGPNSDGYVGLANSNKGKEYNQSFRSAGRYLGWRN